MQIPTAVKEMWIYDNCRCFLSLFLEQAERNSSLGFSNTVLRPYHPKDSRYFNIYPLDR
jgi:hypothetical protein